MGDEEQLRCVWSILARGIGNLKGSGTLSDKRVGYAPAGGRFRAMTEGGGDGGGREDEERTRRGEERRGGGGEGGEKEEGMR